MSVHSQMPFGDLWHHLEVHHENDTWNSFGRHIALDVASALDYLHTQSPVIIHGDLKTPNILIDNTKSRRIGVLADFGSAEVTAEEGGVVLKRAQATLSRLWSAPELKRLEPFTPAVDIYSFGVVLWELFTGQKPWGNDPSLADAPNAALPIPVGCPPYLTRLIEARSLSFHLFAQS